MSRNPQRLQVYLAHIIEATRRIYHYTEDLDELGFLENELVQDAVIRNIEIIGEASNNIDKHYKDFAQLLRRNHAVNLLFSFFLRK